MVHEEALFGFATGETPRYKNWFMFILRVKRVIEPRGKFKPAREKRVKKEGAVSLMAVHFILLIILPITYIACEQALNYQLRFLIRYEFLFRIPNEKFAGFQNPDYLTLGDTF